MSVSTLRVLCCPDSNQARRIKPEQAQKTYERALKLGEEFAEYFTGERARKLQTVLVSGIRLLDGMDCCSGLMMSCRSGIIIYKRPI